MECEKGNGSRSNEEDELRVKEKLERQKEVKKKTKEIGEMF